MPYVVRSTVTAVEDREKTREKKKERSQQFPQHVLLLVPPSSSPCLQECFTLRCCCCYCCCHLLSWREATELPGQTFPIINTFSLWTGNSLLSNFSLWLAPWLLIKLVSVQRMHVWVHAVFFSRYVLNVMWPLAQCAKHGHNTWRRLQHMQAGRQQWGSVLFCAVCWTHWENLQ